MNIVNTFIRTISYSKDLKRELGKNKTVASRYFKDLQYLHVIQNTN